ncbi:MAG TPA: helix-turn-helix domain-containing protein, partial [Clostridia bacterium]|nr:helix-turn-helix domain-containing protein [Clostridia bacterium]
IESNHMDYTLNNNIIADRLNISSGYLSKMFRLQYGMSMMDCLYHLRINRAKHFLRETRLTIDEIAEKTGFVSASALIKMFKKYEGVTPGIYRKLTESAGENATT